MVAHAEETRKRCDRATRNHVETARDSFGFRLPNLSGEAQFRHYALEEVGAKPTRLDQHHWPFDEASDDHARQWETLIDTAGSGADSALLDACATVPIAGHAVVVLRAQNEPAVEVDHSVAASLAAAADAPAVQAGRTV